MNPEFSLLDKLRRTNDATANLTNDEYVCIPWSVNWYNMCAWVQSTQIHDEQADVHYPATYVSIYFGNMYYSPAEEFRDVNESLPDWIAAEIEGSQYLRTTCGVHCTLAYLPEMSWYNRKTLRQLLNRRICDMRDAWLRDKDALRTFLVESLRVRSWYLRSEDPYDFGRVVKAVCAESAMFLTHCIENELLELPQRGLYVTINTHQELETRVQRDEHQRTSGESLLNLALEQRHFMRRAYFEKGWLPFRYRTGTAVTRIHKVGGAAIRLLLRLCQMAIEYDAGGYHMIGFNKKLHRIIQLDKMHVTPQPMDAPAICVSTGEIEIPEQDDWSLSACDTTLVLGGRL